jgi:hypothetical protein
MTGECSYRHADGTEEEDWRRCNVGRLAVPCLDLDLPRHRGDVTSSRPNTRDCRTRAVCFRTSAQGLTLDVYFSVSRGYFLRDTLGR